MRGAHVLPLAVLVLALVAAGCSGPAPPSDGPTVLEELVDQFDYRVLDDRGDWYMHLKVQGLEDRTACSTLLTATGTSVPDGPDYIVGAAGPKGMTLLGSGRSGWGQVHQGEATVTADGGTYQSGFLSDEPGAGMRLDQSEVATLFWAARGVASDGFHPFPMRALMECDHPVRIVERGVATEFRLFDERSFTTAVAPINAVVYSSGDLLWSGSNDRTLFAFTHYGAQEATIDLAGDTVEGHWDASGYRFVQDWRQGFTGDVALHLEQRSPPVNQQLRTPWMEGIFVQSEAVARFPHEGEVADRTWSWTLEPDGMPGAGIAIDATVEAATSCSFAVTGAGTAPAGYISNAFALWGASPAQLDWFSEAGHFYQAGAAGQGVSDDEPWSYSREGDGRALTLSAGTSHLAWPMSGPSHGNVTLTCSGPVAVANAGTYASEIPTSEAQDGVIVATFIPGGVASGSHHIPIPGNVTLLTDTYLETLRVTHAGGVLDLPPQTPLAAYDLVGPLTVERTGTVSQTGFDAVIARP